MDGIGAAGRPACPALRALHCGGLRRAVVFSPMSTPEVALSASGARGSRIGAYVALTKPRIIELLLVTTLPTMIVAKRGLPSIWLMVATLMGGSLAAGGAKALNIVVDRDIGQIG